MASQNTAKGRKLVNLEKYCLTALGSRHPHAVLQAWESIDNCCPEEDLGAFGDSQLNQ